MCLKHWILIQLLCTQLGLDLTPNMSQSQSMLFLYIINIINLMCYLYINVRFHIIYWQWHTDIIYYIIIILYLIHCTHGFRSGIRSDNRTDPKYKYKSQCQLGQKQKVSYLIFFVVKFFWWPGSQTNIRTYILLLDNLDPIN